MKRQWVDTGDPPFRLSSGLFFLSALYYQPMVYNQYSVPTHRCVFQPSASDVICSAVRVGEARQGGEGEPAQMGFKAAVPFVGMTMAECAQVGIMTFSKAAMSIGMSNFVSPLL
ncbi:hypothetical protein NC652_025433 [Populus alba x Populus x berolinensis]|nr:hypothetical protein NC652_025433 [Populus alba x Populus x berolinensis]